jgi:hypothetical protein
MIAMIANDYGMKMLNQASSLIRLDIFPSKLEALTQL